MILTAHSAIAQYSGPVYTGGQASFGGKNYPYGLGTNGYGGGGPGACTCSGEITATFTWNGGVNSTPPPDSVIVEQSSSAYWQGETIPVDPQGACNNGLNDAEVDQEQIVYPGIYMEIGMSEGTHYSTQTPSSNGNITLTCSPSANVTNTAASEAEVGYTASILPVTIQVSGVTNVIGQDEVLPGQVCSAQLVLPGGFICTSCVWSISGQIYTSWEGNGLNKPVLTPVDSTTLKWKNTSSQPVVAQTPKSPPWYWDDTNTKGQYVPETVSCNADIIAPDGTTFQIQVTHNVKQVMPSAITFTGNIGYGAILGGSNGWEATITGAGNSLLNGISFNLSANTPPEFATGKLEMIQIINTQKDSWTMIVNGQAYPLTLNVVDNSDHAPPYIIPPNQTNVLADGTTFSTFDNPFLSLTGLIQSNQEPFYDSTFSIQRNFQDYLMFLPPCANAYWVPLMNLTWQWNCSANIPGTGWTTIDPLPSTSSSTSSTKAKPDNTYPFWTNIH